jgi:putative oxidoreductase
VGRGGDVALLLLRLTGLGMALSHGFPKLARMAGGDTGFISGVEKLGFPLPVVFAWASVLTETLGALLLVLGVFTRLTAAVSAVNMAVAAFLRHKAHLHWMAGLGLARYGDDTLKAWGNPELALVYLVAFAALALLGGGRFALERAFGRGGGGRPGRTRR